ncbi:MAG: MATE family efflux transporter [Clostridia bacterium]|nr:MATE family efflux transporter [Clostridia bacterium]MBQ9774281.1 MATE family efflux transporter [Clostridia bacterium]
MEARTRRHDVDMTSGSIVRHLLYFALPLLLGNIFQQLYNMVDTWVVGNYVSNEAFSAVGSVGPITNMLIGFFGGLSSGAGAVISQYYGAKQYDKVRDTVHTALIMTAVLGVVFTVLGIAIAPLMLGLMKTPKNVIGESQAYLTIYFAGIMGLMIYNVGAGILRAVGDSRRPFYFLVVSAVINTVLDLVFVLCFDLGVRGVAYATIIAQGVSALLVLLTLLTSNTCVRVQLRALRCDFSLLGKIIKIGIPAALQMAVTGFSNVFVQSYINAFGANGMSGWTAYAKIDQLILLPMQSVSLASTTFVAQNLGSRQDARARAGVRRALMISWGTTAVLMIPVMIFAPYLVAFFNDTPAVIAYGTLLLRWISPFYLLCCVNQILAGALRGAGNTRAPMVIMLSSFVLFRQVYLYFMTDHIIPYLQSVMDLTQNMRLILTAMSYPAGWLLATVLTSLYYHNVKLTKSTVIEENTPKNAQA